MDPITFRGRFYRQIFIRRLLYLKADYFAAVEIEAGSRGRSSIRGKLFSGMKWGHFLYGGLILMGWTLVLRMRQHS
jgi:hypothetical protein